MKKVVLGTGLLICGILIFITSQIRDAIYFASPNNISTHGTDPLMYFAGAVILFGIILNISGFIEKKDDDRRE